jgi:hypothetical protein
MREPKPPTYGCVDGVHRFTFEDGVRLDVHDLAHTGRHSLEGEVVAYLEGGAPVNRATLNLLDQRARVFFHEVASQLSDRASKIDWQLRLLAAVDVYQTHAAQVEAAEAVQHGLPSTEAAEPFPIDAFPTPLAHLIREASAALPCPPDFLGVPMLSVLGTAIGTTRELEVKRGWCEGPRAYTAVIADPGSKKSPALALVMRPLEAWQVKLEEAFATAKAAYAQELVQHEIDLAAWTKLLRQGTARAEDKPPAPETPVKPQLIVMDTTLEALAVLLEANPRGIVMMRDELTAWARAMNQYKGGKGADRQYWLSFWSGAPVIVNRKSRQEPITLPRPLICVAACLPPDVLSDLADERGREDGFLHRILFGYPDPLPGRWTEAVVSESTLSGYLSLVETLCAPLGSTRPLGAGKLHHLCQ